MLHIHPNPRTTPATRAEIARFSEPSGTVARCYGRRGSKPGDTWSLAKPG